MYLTVGELIGKLEKLPMLARIQPDSDNDVITILAPETPTELVAYIPLWKGGEK